MAILCHWLLLGLLAASPAYADGISGTYVGQGANGAFLVQIVETAGGQVTGRFEETVLQPDGKLVRTIDSITGASDGQTVVVTLKAPELLSDSISASGTLTGTSLHLSGGGAGRTIDLTLSKGDETTYQNQVAYLSGRGYTIIEARTQSDNLARLNDLTKKMLTYSTAADEQLTKFPPIEKRYRTITSLMTQALARERSIYGEGQASVARGQIDVAINQGAGDAEQIHVSVQSAKQAIGAQTRPLLKDTLAASPHCHSAESQQSIDMQAACLKFREAATKYQKSLDNLEQAFDQAERVWTAERSKQEAIIHAADIASR
jgi:hypothetical protein